MTCPRVIVALGLVVALVALGGLPRAAAKEYALKPVNGGAFEELVVIPEIVAAVEFYSGERSDEAAEAWEKVARLLDGKAVVAEVNCDADDLAETCSKYKAGDLGAGEAAIKIFQAGSKRAPAAYTKEREPKEIAAFVGALIPSFVVPINPATLEPFMVDFSRPLKVILATAKEETPVLFKALSRDFKDVAHFGQVQASETDLLARLHITKAPKIIALLPNPTDPTQQMLVQYDGKTQYRRVAAWIRGVMAQTNELHEQLAKQQGDQAAADASRKASEAEAGGVRGTGVVDHVTSPDDFDAMCGRIAGLCVITIFNHADLDTDDTELYFARLSSLAATEKRPVRYLWLDSRNTDFTAGFNLDFGFPAVLVLSASKGRFHVHRGSLEASSISDTIDNVLKGRARTSKVDPVPALAEGLVHDSAFAQRMMSATPGSGLSEAARAAVEAEAAAAAAEAEAEARERSEAEEAEARLAAAMAAINKANSKKEELQRGGGACDDVYRQQER